MQNLNMGIKTTQNFTLISKLLRKMWNLLTKSKSQNSVKFEFLLFYISNLQKYLANNFFCVYFFPIISTDLKS